MSTRSPQTDLRRGALYMVASALLFASMAAAVRVASRELPNAPIVFFRHFIMLRSEEHTSELQSPY